MLTNLLVIRRIVIVRFPRSGKADVFVSEVQMGTLRVRTDRRWIEPAISLRALKADVTCTALLIRPKQKWTLLPHKWIFVCILLPYRALHVAVVQGKLDIVLKIIQLLQAAHKSLDIFNNLRQVESPQPLNTTTTPRITSVCENSAGSLASTWQKSRVILWGVMRDFLSH